MRPTDCQVSAEIVQQYLILLEFKFVFLPVILMACFFPNIWKDAVVVVKKPGRDIYDTLKAYRPIG